MITSLVTVHFLSQRGLSPLHVAVMSKKNRMVGTLLQYQHVLKLDIDIRSTQDVSKMTIYMIVYAYHVLFKFMVQPFV